ncbi:MAG: phasin family protein [Oxalobacteraceae bacterium]|nr:phasin family protein [Oxalobacteraceae bacterium]
MADSSPQFIETAMKSAAQNMMEVSAASMKGIEKIAQLHLKIARDATQHGAESAKALTMSKNPQDLAKVQADWLNFSLESMTALGSALCGIGIETAKAWSKKKCRGTSMIAFNTAWSRIPLERNSSTSRRRRPWCLGRSSKECAVWAGIKP